MKRSERMGFQLICWQNNTLRRPHPHLSSTSCDKISFLFFWPWHRLMFQSPLRRSNPCKVFVSVTIGGQWDIVSVSIAATHAKATGLRNEDLSALGNWAFSCSGRAADYVCVRVLRRNFFLCHWLIRVCLSVGCLQVGRTFSFILFFFYF